MYVIAKIPEVLRFMFSKKEITSNLDFPITMIIIILIMIIIILIMIMIILIMIIIILIMIIIILIMTTSKPDFPITII